MHGWYYSYYGQKREKQQELTGIEGKRTAVAVPWRLPVHSNTKKTRCRHCFLATAAVDEWVSRWLLMVAEVNEKGRRSDRKRAVKPALAGTVVQEECMDRR